MERFILKKLNEVEGKEQFRDEVSCRFPALDPREINGNNLNNARYEASRHFRNKKREYLKDKINDLTTNSKNKHIRDLNREINEFKRGYQLRNNLVKDENGIQIPTIFQIHGRTTFLSY
jgi:hypothetical protein